MVLKKFIELAEEKVTEAQAKAEKVQSDLEASAPASANVEDLDAVETPETILLATVSGEQSKDRTERAVVTPWLKFLWETYRTVLEILKNNARLEIMYQSTALQAFQFCLKYQRKTEFRRLCELLRNHYMNAAKYSTQMHAINLQDPDTLQRHSDTRFQQLNVAVELELWQEAFRSVDDIHQLLSQSKRPAKNTMMSNYYEKLTKIFLVSDNFLFHAAAWNKYYTLLRIAQNAVTSGQGAKKDNPVVSEADVTKAGNYVLLSALAIPAISNSRSRGAMIDLEETRKTKNVKLTNLLNMSTPPSRSSLFKDATSKGLLSRVKPEIKELYQILEVDFHPLSICKKISPILTQIAEDSEMEKYIVPLQQVILTRLFEQLSQVYESVDLNFVHKLAQFPAPYQIEASTIEKFIMKGCKKGDLAIRLDHVSGILTFDNDVFSSTTALSSTSMTGSADNEAGSIQKLQNTPSEIARTQLSRLAKVLHVTCMYVDPSYSEARRAARDAALARANAGMAQEQEQLMARRAIIEKRKEMATDALQRKQREEETRRRIRTQQAAAQEAERLKNELQDRERRRVLEEQARIRRQEIEKQVEELKGGVKGLDLEGMNLEDLDSSTIRAMKLAQLEKENQDKNSKVAITAKRIDHLERAFRREELKLLPADYEKQLAYDRQVYEQNKKDTLRDALIKHKEGLELKHRLGRLVSQYDSFKSDVEDRRHDEFEKRRKAAERDFENKKKQRVKEVRERRARERSEAEDRDRKEREEQERIEREEAEKAEKEEKRRVELEERKAKALAQRAEADEAARKQAQREAEAEERRKQRKEQERGAAGLSRPSAPPLESKTSAPFLESRTDSNERTAPKLQIASRTGAGGGGGWREREAARAAGGGAPQETTAPPVREPVARSGYVPPHQRGKDGPALGRAPESERNSSRDNRDARDTKSPAPAPENVKPAANNSGGGKWVPPHLRNKQ